MRWEFRISPDDHIIHFTWNEEYEEVGRGDDRGLYVESGDDGVAVHQPAATVEEGEGEENVLHAVDDEQVLVLSSNSCKF